MSILSAFYTNGVLKPLITDSAPAIGGYISLRGMVKQMNGPLADKSKLRVGYASILRSKTFKTDLSIVAARDGFQKPWAFLPEAGVDIQKQKDVYLHPAAAILLWFRFSAEVLDIATAMSHPSVGIMSDAHNLDESNLEVPADAEAYDTGTGNQHMKERTPVDTAQLTPADGDEQLEADIRAAMPDQTVIEPTAAEPDTALENDAPFEPDLPATDVPVDDLPVDDAPVTDAPPPPATVGSPTPKPDETALLNFELVNGAAGVAEQLIAWNSDPAVRTCMALSAKNLFTTAELGHHILAKTDSDRYMAIPYKAQSEFTGKVKEYLGCIQSYLLPDGSGSRGVVVYPYTTEDGQLKVDNTHGGIVITQQ